MNAAKMLRHRYECRAMAMVTRTALAMMLHEELKKDCLFMMAMTSMSSGTVLVLLAGPSMSLIVYHSLSRPSSGKGIKRRYSTNINRGKEVMIGCVRTFNQ